MWVWGGGALLAVSCEFVETACYLFIYIWQVKTVYLEPVPPSWDGKKIEEICKEYGAIEKIKLYRNSKTRRKDFAFVEFVSRESAMNCVAGLSKALVDRDDTKVYIFPNCPY